MKCIFEKNGQIVCPYLLSQKSIKLFLGQCVRGFVCFFTKLWGFKSPIEYQRHIGHMRLLFGQNTPLTSAPPPRKKKPTAVLELYIFVRDLQCFGRNLKLWSKSQRVCSKS